MKVNKKSNCLSKSMVLLFLQDAAPKTKMSNSRHDSIIESVEIRARAEPHKQGMVYYTCNMNSSIC